MKLKIESPGLRVEVVKSGIESPGLRVVASEMVDPVSLIPKTKFKLKHLLEHIIFI